MIRKKNQEFVIPIHNEGKLLSEKKMTALVVIPTAVFINYL